MVSLRDVAKAAGVSIATVSHVINGTRYVSPELTERVHCALQELHYQPNLVARSLRTQRSQTIGLVTSEITNPFYPGVANGANEFSAQHDYSLILYDTGESEEKEKAAVHWLQQRQIDGLLFTSIHQDSATVKTLFEQNYPFVLINRQIRDIKANYVGLANEDGMAQVVHHLVELGHQTVGFIGGSSGSTAAHERLNGFLVAAQKHGLESEPRLIYRGNYRIGDGYMAVQHFLNVRPDITAIVAANDLMAFGAWQCLHQLDIDVPDDISIVGYDDIPPASMGPVGLTTVHAPQHKMGELSAKLLIEMLETRPMPDPEQIILPVNLIIRDTTAPRRRKRKISLLSGGEPRFPHYSETQIKLQQGS